MVPAGHFFLLVFSMKRRDYFRISIFFWSIDQNTIKCYKLIKHQNWWLGDSRLIKKEFLFKLHLILPFYGWPWNPNSLFVYALTLNTNTWQVSLILLRSLYLVSRLLFLMTVCPRGCHQSSHSSVTDCGCESLRPGDQPPSVSVVTAAVCRAGLRCMLLQSLCRLSSRCSDTVPGTQGQASVTSHCTLHLQAGPATILDLFVLSSI